jgi:nitrite reductase/ring-hydroxylating ferredoxin subunit
MIMTDYVEVARLDQVPPGRSMVVTVAGQEVALFNVEGDIYAIDDSCAHAGASLGAGKLDGKIITCRAHGARYDVTTGYRIGADSGVAAFLVKVVDGKIQVAIS